MPLVFLADTLPAADPISVLVQYGIPGIILMLLLTGYLWPKPAVDQLKAGQIEENKRHAEERDMWEKRILPVMERVATGLETNNGLLRTNSNEVSELASIIRQRKNT